MRNSKAEPGFLDSQTGGWNPCLVVALLVALAVPANGQNFEVGVQLTGLHLHKIDEGPVGFGGRFHYQFFPLLSSDVEWTHYPENQSGNFGETAALFGVRAGKRFERIGLFVKLRPGVMHFGGKYFIDRLDRKTHFILDAGGELEYYPTRRTFLRLDLGDTVIYYGGARFNDRPDPDPLGTVHNFQSGIGVGLRF